MGCILYADDIILLSASIDGLQKMLNVCSTVATEIHLHLGLLSGPQFKIDSDVIRRKFYASANTVLANSFHQDDIFSFIWLKAVVYQFYSIAAQLLN